MDKNWARINFFCFKKIDNKTAGKIYQNLLQFYKTYSKKLGY